MSEAVAYPLADSPITQQRVYAVEEHGTVDVSIDQLLGDGYLAVFPEIVSKKYFAIDLRGDQLVLRAGSFVGLIPLNSRIAIEVKPRVPISNLARILRISGQTPVAIARQSRDYSLDDEAAPSLLDHFALALLDGIRDIECFGILRDYQGMLADTSMPRGRIDIGHTLVRHASRHRLDRVIAGWHEVTVDTGANRCLKFALWLLAQRYARIQNRKGSRKILQMLARAFRVFDGVQLDVDLRFMHEAIVQDPVRLPLIRNYYASPLKIALAVIRNQSIRLDEVGHQVRLASLVIDMDRVFEAYVREILRTGLVDAGLLALNGNRSGFGFGGKLLFDEPPSEQANPDVVVCATTAETAAVVVDAKYKPVAAAPDRSDINQAIAYGASYRCKRVVLVHPCPSGRASGLKRIGTIGELGIYQHMLDLASTDVEEEERRFVEAIAVLSDRAEAPRL